MEGHTYYFQCKAEDNVGRRESYPGGSGDTSTFVDASAPDSSVSPLSAYQANETFTVSWSGSDGAGSGVMQYDVQYRDGAVGVWTD